jgi:hypothetical protein
MAPDAGAAVKFMMDEGTEGDLQPIARPTLPG